MKEKISKIMKSGGWAVLIATVAMAAYLLILQWGDNFIKNQTVELKITIDENGYLSTNYGGSKDGVYIIWQTDGGNIQPVHKDEKLAEQYYDGNKWYFAYTAPNDKIKWSSEDADGNKYTEATIRATLYMTDRSKTVFYIGEYVNEASVTVKSQDGKAVKAEDRLFSNPVREGDSNWSQIYEISDFSGQKTFAYRTGYVVENPGEKILVWEADEKIMNETDLRYGAVGPFIVNPEKSGKDMLIGSSMITFNVANIKDEFNVTAYLTYSDNSEKKQGEITVEEQFYNTSHKENKQ